MVESELQSDISTNQGLFSPLDQQPHVRVRMGSQARCVMCRHNKVKTASGWDIITMLKCDTCQVPLCKGNKNCFQMYHTMLFAGTLPFELLPFNVQRKWNFMICIWLYSLCCRTVFNLSNLVLVVLVNDNFISCSSYILCNYIQCIKLQSLSYKDYDCILWDFFFVAVSIYKIMLLLV